MSSPWIWIPENWSSKWGIDIMSEEEFLELDYGDIVTCKRYPREIYEIDDTDVFGVGDRDPIFRVFGAKDRRNNKDIRIDMQNYAVWDVLSR